MCASTDEEEHVVHGPQPLANAGKSLYCVRDLQRLQVCRTLRINMRSKWQVINWQNGRSYLLSKKDHGGDRKSDGYIIESSCQLDNLKNSGRFIKMITRPNLTKNIYVYPIANYYKNVLDEKNGLEVSDWLFTCYHIARFKTK